MNVVHGSPPPGMTSISPQPMAIVTNAPQQQMFGVVPHQVAAPPAPVLFGGSNGVVVQQAAPYYPQNAASKPAVNFPLRTSAHRTASDQYFAWFYVINFPASSSSPHTRRASALPPPSRNSPLPLPFPRTVPAWLAASERPIRDAPMLEQCSALAPQAGHPQPRFCFPSPLPSPLPLLSLTLHFLPFSKPSDIRSAPPTLPFPPIHEDRLTSSCPSSPSLLFLLPPTAAKV
jgi:hypothetical protein